MKIIKIVGYCAASLALLSLTGFDCPDCDYVVQTSVLLASAFVALVCGIIVTRKEG
jgi:hypothetical protein